MNKKVIAIDIDDVLFPFIPTLAEHHNRNTGARLTSADFFTYHFSEVLGVEEQEANEIVSALLRQDVVHLQPLPGARAALERLAADFTVVFVTARNGHFEPGTRQWLDAHFNNMFEDVIFAGNPYDCSSYREKGVVCQELGACLLIDDNPTNLLSALDYDVDAILFGKHPWNIEHTLPKSVPHCATWSDVLDYVYNSRHIKNASSIRA